MIDLEALALLFAETLLADPEGRDAQVEATDFLRVIHLWHAERVEAIQAQFVPDMAALQHGSGVKIPRPGKTMCDLGRPLRDHARPCAPSCDYRPTPLTQEHR